MIASLFAALAAIGPVPQGPTSAWITPDDYPPAAIIRGAQGEVSIAVTVGSDGRPKSCEVKASSGDTGLDALSCTLVMQRASFRPGRDEAGSPVDSVFRVPIRWALPLQRLSDKGGVFHYTFDDQGKISGCKTERLGDFDENMSCDTFGVEKLLQMFLGDQLSSFSTAEISILFQVIDTPYKPSTPLPDRHIIGESLFDVDDHGKVLKCTATATYQFQGRTLNICDWAPVGKVAFALSPKASGIRHAKVSFEISGTRKQSLTPAFQSPPAAH